MLINLLKPPINQFKAVEQKQKTGTKSLLPYYIYCARLHGQTGLFAFLPPPVFDTPKDVKKVNFRPKIRNATARKQEA